MSTKKIIVVDDSPAILDSVKLMLNMEGFEVSNYERGSDMFNSLLETSTKPDVILMDMWLSGEDGRDICKMIKQHQEFKNIPVVIMSASRGLGDSAIESGAIDFIPYRGDFARGIFATEVVRVDASVDAGYFAGLYKEYYKDAAFTHYVDKAIDMKQVVNTNKALVHLDKFGDKLLVTATIDNLLKGASGQAVQNMNLMFGLDETSGLRLKPSAF